MNPVRNRAHTAHPEDIREQAISNRVNFRCFTATVTAKTFFAYCSGKKIVRVQCIFQLITNPLFSSSNRHWGMWITAKISREKVVIITLVFSDL